MKPTSSSIYRRIELLTDWLIPVIDRMPKSISSNIIGDRLINSIMNAQEYTAIALRSANISDRIEAIRLMILCTDTMRYCMRTIYERSRNSSTRVINTEQYSHFVGEMEKIGDETAKWLSSAERNLKNVKS